MPEPKTGEHIRRSPGGGQLPFRGSTRNASPARTTENYQNDDSKRADLSDVLDDSNVHQRAVDEYFAASHLTVLAQRPVTGPSSVFSKGTEEKVDPYGFLRSNR